ncbi:AAA domain-containing protein [Belliella kenyensis]|uniref:DNA helicase n=1 Tax=Belliella kenyensis TaxID=1472724 RepID=A0ABV8ELK0_9BACT|nr:AAA domain-containing protein [Belliella kenyensis]MCH7403648.1 AAA domain-containing protein [Belliella kenyensis]MDN3602198.1 AAA domain-containing protein [Belliella kenyensis]
MVNIQEELSFSLKLLKEEWKEDLQQYRAKFAYTSISDRKEQGVCWYPVIVKKSKIGMGDRVILELDRTDSNQAHVFQSGKSVSIFSNQPHRQSQEYAAHAVVNFVKKDTMVVTLQGDYLPDWIEEGRLGVDLLFDEASYREMEFALKAVQKAEKGRLGELKQVLLGAQLARFQKGKFHKLSYLNQTQNEALELVNNAQDVAIIHGPPGTGKTTTLVAAIEDTLHYEKQVMVNAPSNAAVDLLVEKLCELNVNVLRIGHPARVEERILAQTLDSKISQHPSYKDLKKLRKSAESYRSLGQKYKRNFGHEERMQRKRLLEEAKRTKEDAEHLENYIVYDIFQATQVVACTMVGASNHALKGMNFPVVFIDEAAQGLEAATWIPIMKANKVVMAGDHCQLPPTIKSIAAAKAGLSETLFEKAIKRQPDSSKMLTTQYRMPSAIMGFSSSYFYHGKLEAADNTISHHFGEDEPVLEFVDTAGSGYLEQQERNTMSTLNADEAKFALDYLEMILKRIGIATLKQEKRNIGLISPYRAQVRKFKELIFESYDYPNLRAFEDLLTIDSIDGFQGQERDVIIISLVRSNTKGEIGFLADVRRMNVALTRAKRKLVIIGDSATLATHPFYDNLLNYIQENGTYRSIYEFLSY